MNDQSISSMLNNIHRNIDADLAVTIADVLNLYLNSIKRNASRQILGPQDAVRVLHIISFVLEACNEEADPELIPGRPVRGQAVPNTP